jgi:tRNA(fMet)-specific endonuclease VapC
VPLLDTSLVLHAVRGSKLFEQADRDFWLTSRADAAMISIVTVGEMLALARKKSWGSEGTEALNERLAQLAVVGIDSPEVLERYAELDSFCEKRGRGVGQNDLWIAACASALDAVLLTTDKDFEPLPESLLRQRWYDPDASY